MPWPGRARHNYTGHGTPHWTVDTTLSAANQQSSIPQSGQSNVQDSDDFSLETWSWTNRTSNESRRTIGPGIEAGEPHQLASHVSVRILQILLSAIPDLMF